MNSARPRLAGTVVLIGCLAAAGCGTEGRDGSGHGAPPPSGNELVVERSSADGADTVRTVSGSRWGGDGSLAEVLSIGDEIGEEAYLFGSISAAWATDDRIYMIDAQVPAVRVFDAAGRYLLDIGRPGQGPGEYQRPAGLAVTADGRVVIADVMGARISSYDPRGELLEDWPAGSQKGALGLTLSYDGEVYAQAWSIAEERMGMQAVGPDGAAGEIIFPPSIEFQAQTVSAGKGLAVMVPFAPDYAWAFAPGGEMVAGVGEEYRFEIHGRDGRRTIVEKNWAPVSVGGAEADFYAQLASRTLRRMDPDLGISGAELPDHKPAFVDFIPDRSGRVWVVREGPGRPDPVCTAADSPPALVSGTAGGATFRLSGKPGPAADDELAGECWASSVTFDLFDIVTGEFLGAVEAPESGFRAPLFASDDTVLAAVADEIGTLRLKRYRLRIDRAETLDQVGGTR